MDKVFLAILNMSLTGAFIIAAICLARLPLKKAPKIISYCLWAVAGFRLVFPLSIESVFSLLPFKAQPIPSDIATQAVPRIDSGIPFINNAVSSALPAAAPAASVNPLQVWTAIGAYVWIIGVAVMLIFGVVSYLLLKRKMCSAIRVVDSVYESDIVHSPFVLGVINPKIYIPLGLSGTEREYILLHERTHIRRHDHIVKFAAYFILCLHWFNPLAWIAFLLMGVDMEMSCDERVLNEMGMETKRDYSLSLLSLAANRRVIGGSPLAFSEGGLKQRIKNVLNFKKPSRVIIISAAALAVVLSVGFAVNRVIAIDKNFPMQGVNLSDLQPEEIIQNIVQITGAKSDDVIIPGWNNFQIDVTENFEWGLSGAISIYISKNKTGGEPYYACQLRIFPDDLNFFVTDTQRLEAPERQYRLLDYLNALRYLPQEHIRSLTHDNPDEYIINFVDDGVPDDNQPCVYYDMDGVTESNGWTIRFDIQPMYQNEDGTGYHGVGSDVIHVFYGSRFYGEQMTLDDIRTLAAKGNGLLFQDLQGFRGADASSNTNYHIMVYSVEGGYRLIVRSKDNSKPDNISLESIWESGGSGIDIRYNDVDEFIRTHPSHAAIIGEEALVTAANYTGKILTLIDVDWWEREDEFPHYPKDPFKRTLDESLKTIEPCELFTDGEGGFIAVGRKYGTVYVYDNGAWVSAIDNTKPNDTAPPVEIPSPTQIVRQELLDDGCKINYVFIMAQGARKSMINAPYGELATVYASYTEGEYGDAICCMRYDFERAATDSPWTHSEPIFWDGIAVDVAAYRARTYFAEQTGVAYDNVVVSWAYQEDIEAILPDAVRTHFAAFYIGESGDAPALIVLTSADGESHWKVVWYNGDIVN